MNTITLVLENRFKDFASNLNWVMNEAKDIDAAYFATDASTLVGALPSGGSGASLATKLTKTQYQNAIGLIEQINNFFSNASVTTGDYLNTLDNVTYGNAAAPALLSDAAESLANRLYTLAAACRTHYLTAKDILNLYNNSELSVVIAGCTGSRTVYGASMNVTQLTQGITVVEQWKKMIGNESVATGLYSANVAIWMMV